ncbi:MAG TPA: alkaline phosphatase family protein [Candidatus Angelobacter sp.]|nr:alkaline phosphatase family protein [Candidatus Angelobacter sp.]
MKFAKLFLVNLGLFFLAVGAPTIATAQTHIKTVWIILMENHNWSQIKGSSSAPYISNTLLPMASHAEQYFNPPGIHPSLPNYLWLEAGTNFGIKDDKNPSSHKLTTTQHLVTLLQNKAISWKSYQESISGTTCPLTSSGEYAPKHDPFVYFTDVTNNLNPNSAECINHIRPFTEFASDLANNNVSQYNFITPNLCDDMHDSCSPTNDPIKQGDNWLSQNIPNILNSTAYKNGGAIFITWDEAASGDGPIGMIVLSPFAKGNGFQNSIHYTHGSTLRTIEEIFGVTPLLGDAANETDLSNLFSVFP